MSRRLTGASLLLAAFVLLPAVDVHAQKKKKDAPKKSDVPVDSATLAAGDFIGILKAVPGNERLFTVETETKRLVATGKGGRGGNNNANRVLQLQAQIQQTQIQANNARTPQQRNQAVRRLQQLQMQLQQTLAQMQQRAINEAGKAGDAPPGTKWETRKQLVEFQATDNVKVRTLFLPEQFDEKGNIKEYTEKEKTELKGKDKSLPGYESSLEKLEVGQKVRVVLAPAPRKAAKKEGEQSDEDKEVNKKMQVKLIVIQEESTGAPAPRAKGKKKK